MVAFGKFRVLEKLGARGSWILYDVLEVAQDRKVELRVYSNRLSEGSEKETAFLDTLKALAAIDHSHVLGIWDLGVVMEKGYYTVPPRDAISLREALIERDLDILDEVERLEAAVQLCRALQSIHDAGFTHGAISSESVYWDRRRGFAYISWIPILERNNSEFRFDLGPVPKGYEGKSEDIYRLASILHHILLGTQPLVGDDVTGASAAVNVPGGIEGAFEVLEQGLRQDPTQNFPEIADLAKQLDRTLSKQRVRAELEKSVSSMVIPQEVLEAALKKKKEQKKRRQAQDGISPAEAVYESPLASLNLSQNPLVGLAAVLILVMGLGSLFLGSGGTSEVQVASAPTKRPPPKRPAPKSSTPKPKIELPKKKSQKKEDIHSLKGASATSGQDFLDRWGILKTWILSLPPSKRRQLFTYGTLVRLRAKFKKDEYQACRKLDDLIRQAVSEVE